MAEMLAIPAEWKLKIHDRTDPRHTLLAGLPVRHGVPQHLGRVRRVVDQRPGPGLDVVAEHHRHLVSVGGAAEVTKLRAPVRRVGDLGAQARRPGQPDGQQRGAHLRLQRLTERAVLSQREHGDQLAKAQLIHPDPPAGKAADRQKIRSSPDARPRARS